MLYKDKRGIALLMLGRRADCQHGGVQDDLDPEDLH